MTKKENIEFNKNGQWKLKSLEKTKVTTRIPKKEPAFADSKTKTAVMILPLGGVM